MNNPLSAQQDFSSQTHNMAVVETSSTAMAAQAKAMIESRYVMAMRNPRNWDQVREELIKECRRPTFANNKSAYYVKPIGAGVEGLGIRFVEVALRCMKNVLIETNMIFEDKEKEIHRVSVTDLESNVTYPLDVKVTKTVERSKPSDDGSYVSVRQNTQGRKTFTVVAQDDDLLNKRGAMISKAIRTLGLRIIPGDLCDEAEDIIKRIRLDDAAKDPNATRKRLVDSFAEIGVKVGALIDYIGHDLDSLTPAEVVNLRGIYGAIRDGEATWKSVIDNKQPDADSPLTQIMDAIESAKTSAELDLLSEKIGKLKSKELRDATKAWEAKLKTFPVSNVPAEKSLIDQIKSCQTEDELNDIMAEMSENEMEEHGDLINEKQAGFGFDPLG